MDKETVKKVATVARLKLDEEEIETFALELEKILEHFSTISKIEEKGGEKDLYYVLDIDNTYSDDEARKIKEKESEEIRSQFTKSDGKLLTAPKSLK